MSSYRIKADSLGGPGYGMPQPSPHQSGSDQAVRDDSLPAGAPMAIHQQNQKPFDKKEALMIRPYYLDMKIHKVMDNQYPALAGILTQGTADKAETPPMTVKELREFIQSRPSTKDAHEALDEMKTWYFANSHLITVGEDAAFRRTIGDLEHYASSDAESALASAWKAKSEEEIQTDPVPGSPAMQVKAEEDREATKQANFEKLEIESPEQFAIKYKGRLQELAEEHGIGDPIAYSFRTNKIELIGSDAILLLDYEMNALHTRPMYPAEVGEGIVELDSDEVEELDGEEESEE